MAVMQWGRAHQAATFTAAAAVLTVSCRFWAPDLTWLGFTCVLGGITAITTMRVTGDRVLMWLVSASFVVRCLLAVMLFVVSSQRLPLLPSLHAEYGLWAFGVDGISSHEFAVRALDAWYAGTDLPVYVPEKIPFAMPMAAVYWVLGASPLHVVLLNAWLGALCGMLAYRLAGRVGADRGRALASAVIVGFWPSSMIWSTQVLKDVSVLALILCAFVLAAGLWQGASAGPTPPRRGTAGLWRWPALGLAVFALALLRPHIGAALAASLGGTFGLMVMHRVVLRRWREAVTAAGIAGMSVAVMMASTSVDLVALTSPSNPGGAYLRLGETYERHGQVIQATIAYERTLEFNPDSVAAHRGRVRSLIAHGQYIRAARALLRHLELETDDGQREAAIRLMAAQALRGYLELETNPAAREAVIRLMPTDDPVIAAPPSPAPPPPEPAPASQAARPVPDAWPIPIPPGVSEIWTGVVAAVPLLSLDRIATFRQSQIAFAGGALVDTTTFEGWPGFLRFLPRAYVLAFLAPFPWDLMSTGASTGAFRRIAALEILLIALFVPAILIGSWQAVKTFRPEACVMMLFVAGTALSYVLFMPNGGTLFRVRLQFLFPALILAATALPSFVSHAIGALTRHVGALSPRDAAPVRA